MTEGLVGRAEERARLDAMIAGAVASSGSALALVGEPGIGKTALLESARARHDGRVRVLSVVGSEAETDLPFAGLQALLLPLLPLLDALPAAQRRALEGSLALAPVIAGDRLAVHAAVLGLLSIAAEHTPLLLLVDDAHWLDEASADSLAFVARGVEPESIAIVFAQRPGEGRPLDLTGIDPLPLGGLERDDAALLLTRAAGSELPSAVVERLLDATGGNPLALLELPGSLPARQLAGRDPLSDPLAVGPGVKDGFRRRFERLPKRARLAALVVAAAGAEPFDSVAHALAQLGLDPADLEPAEHERLVEVDAAELRFRHPLIRAAAYEAASSSERRAVHRALSTATGGARRAGHLWAAAVGPDEAAAGELEAAAQAARAQSSFGAAALAMERATELTPEGDLRTARLVAAAQDRLTAGDVPRAIAHATEALGKVRDPSLSADANVVLGAVEALSGATEQGYQRLRATGEHLVEHDRERAAWTVAFAMLPCVMDGRVELAHETAERAYELARGASERTKAITAVLLGYSTILSGRDRGDGCAALLDRWTESLDARMLLPGAPHVVGLLMPLAWTERYDDADRAAELITALAAEAGTTGVLPVVAIGQVEVDLRRGVWDRANARVASALRICELAGQSQTPQAGLLLIYRAYVEAASGQEEACRASLQRSMEASGHVGSAHVYWASVLGLLELSLGRLDAAVDHLSDAARRCEQYGQRDPSVVPFGPNLVEALVRSGRREEAERALDVFAEQAERTRRPWARATAARCRGLLTTGAAAEQSFALAYEAHGTRPSPFDLGRTELCHGESLRRARRAREARERLWSALERFEALGATPWAARARSELLAAGGEAGPARVPASHELTPQELEVALAVAEGATNREVASALYVSPKTVEVHLSRVFRKLGVRSRGELAARIARR